MTAPEWPAGIVPGRGDVLSIRRAGSSQEIASAPIGTVNSQGRQLSIKGFHPDVLTTLQEGDPVFIMNDHLAEQSVLKADLRRTRLDLSINGQDLPGEIVSDSLGRGWSGQPDWIDSENCKTVRRGSAPDRRTCLNSSLEKPAALRFRLIKIIVDGSICLSVAELNDLRRQLLDQIGDQLVRYFQRQLPVGFTSDWSEAVADLPTVKDSNVQTQDLAKNHRLLCQNSG